MSKEVATAIAWHLASRREHLRTASHAAGALRDVTGLTVVDATDDEREALYVNSLRPIRVEIARRTRPSWPIAIQR